MNSLIKSRKSTPKPPDTDQPKRNSLLSAHVKPPGRPKIKQEPGCSVHDGWSKNRHVYTMFGAPKESCVKCGCEHPSITEWRQQIIKNPGKNIGHPYVLAGFWSLQEYRKFMKR